MPELISFSVPRLRPPETAGWKDVADTAFRIFRIQAVRGFSVGLRQIPIVGTRNDTLSSAEPFQVVINGKVIGNRYFLRAIV